MKNSNLLFTTLAALAAVGVFTVTGCSSDDSNGDNGGGDSGVTTDSGGGGDSGGGDAGPPAPPTLGAQIDRFGRPTINTALNHTFDLNTAAKGAAKDAYNQDKGVSGWPAAYTGELAANLGILDSLDNNCGNQFGFALANSYAGLGGLLADDKLYVDTSQATCSGTAGYLAVEVSALVTHSATDCGGRTPDADVVLRTYSAASGATGFDDGVAAPASPASTTFPYLADPH